MFLYEISKMQNEASNIPDFKFTERALDEPLVF